MRFRYDVTAYGRPVMREGRLEPRAGVSTRTRVGAWWWARRYHNGYPSGANRYERVSISPRILKRP